MADELKPAIITGLPTGTKEAGRRVDFKPTEFDLLHKTKGYRAWWSRAGVCPCRNNPQTDQPSTTCSLCNGTGWFFFLPEVGLEKYTTDAHGNPIVLNTKKDAVLIQVLSTAATKDPQVFERFGQWVFGVRRITAQAPNRLSYRDRLVFADSVMAWGQLIDYDGAEVIPVSGGYRRDGLRYPAITVNILRSTDQTFINSTDYYIRDDGSLKWLLDAAERPAAGTVLSLHYTIRPVYRVLDHVFVHRDTLVAKKAKAATVEAEFQQMPVQAMAKLDFLIDEDGNV